MLLGGDYEWPYSPGVNLEQASPLSCHSLSCQQAPKAGEKGKKKKGSDNFSLPGGESHRQGVTGTPGSERGCYNQHHSYKLLCDWGIRSIICTRMDLLGLAVTPTWLWVHLPWQDSRAASRITLQPGRAQCNHGCTSDGQASGC